MALAIIDLMNSLDLVSMADKIITAKELLSSMKSAAKALGN